VQPRGFVENSTDCNDINNTIYPGAPELCDGLDNNCDGQVDEGLPGTKTWYRDMDGDGRGTAATFRVACAQPVGFVENADDCNDRDNTIYPGAPELCDGKDNDCNGLRDDGAPGIRRWYFDGDGDGRGAPGTFNFKCAKPIGWVANADDCNDRDNTIYKGAPELCDGLDNNCDGQVDEGLPYTKVWYLDADGDGFGRTSSTKQSCVQPAGFAENNTDCNDMDNTIYLGAPELCDGLDNNCDGQVDEGVPGTKTWYRDGDGDGRGTAATFRVNCAQPVGFVDNADDCNDRDNTIYPGAPELCDGKDNDCNGLRDDGVPGTRTWYRDWDGDGRGGRGSLVACAQPVGFVTNTDDCNDFDKTIYPGAPELCDGLDNNCDGQLDEGLPGRKTWYYDLDGDGRGRARTFRVACGQPVGFVDNADDCNDRDNAIYPGAPELCDGKDNDCNGSVDDACGLIVTSTPTSSMLSSRTIVEPAAPILEARLWPNPARIELMVALDAFAPNQKVEMVLISTEGRSLKAESLVPTVKGQQVRFNVSSYAAGMYLLHIKQGMLSQTKKVMIVR